MNNFLWICFTDSMMHHVVSHVNWIYALIFTCQVYKRWVGGLIAHNLPCHFPFPPHSFMNSFPPLEGDLDGNTQCSDSSFLVLNECNSMMLPCRNHNMLNWWVFPLSAQDGKDGVCDLHFRFSFVMFTCCSENQPNKLFERVCFVCFDTWRFEMPVLIKVFGSRVTVAIMWPLACQ